MNELNPLEKQLQSWIPRRPSADIRSRLFPKAAPAVNRVPVNAPVWLSLAIASSILVLVTFFSLSPHGKAANMAAYGYNSNILASLAPPYNKADTRCQEWNLWHVVTFDWTKSSLSLSTTGSFALGKTNL